MTQFPRLSNREWDVLKLLLEGRSNKLIASSLNISVRTVEFHLKNIYAKFHVSSRIELILKLGNAPGGLEAMKLGCSTVDNVGEVAENRDRLNSQMGWARYFGEVISMIGKESDMKNLLNSKHVLVGAVTAFSTGVLWVATMVYSQAMPPYEFKGLTLPLIVIWAMIGFSVGLIGKRTGSTLRRVFFGALFGTGLSPFLIIPIILTVVLPIGKLAEWLGLIDPSTMSNDVAAILGTAIMLTIWLVIGIAIGISLLFVSFRKPERASAEGA